jgi:hypothetical protein
MNKEMSRQNSDVSCVRTMFRTFVTLRITFVVYVTSFSNGSDFLILRHILMKLKYDVFTICLYKY